MSAIFRSPLRVYLTLAILSLIGIASAMRLPISLFPNSTKPEVTVCISIDLSPDAFLRTYGTTIEEQLKTVERGDLKVENVISTYSSRNACYEIDFMWGGDPQEALREIQIAVNAIKGRLPEESRDRVSVWTGQDNSGFFAVSFYSQKRSLTELYDLLEPALTPQLARVKDAQETILYNPQQLQVLLELKPEAMAAFQLFPSDVAQAVTQVFESYGGGSLTVGSDTLQVEFPRAVTEFEGLRTVQIPTASGRSVSLGDVARLDLSVPLDSSRSFKTSGVSSLILIANPRAGGNVKSMAEEVNSIIESVLPTLPDDIEYKVLVDPSEFIRSAVNNVGKEVALAAGLAVIILFLFVGNFRNVATAAIEIPLSIVLAFIMMRLSGMNLNLISLGGLALSAGMNVDASVVVMENIFRHFEHARGRKLDYEERFKIIANAVKEVQFSVIASTIASLVVFIPLAFTSELSYAILGDLAKAVVFSHGFSAVVALILVPTIRLHLMKDGMEQEKPSFFEGTLVRLENAYARALGFFLDRKVVRFGAYAGLTLLFAALMTFVFPRLPREIIGKPDTDWLILGVSATGNTMTRQMEAQTEQVEARLFEKFGEEILYTFTQINRPNNSFIMFRLKNKKEMEEVWKKVEAEFQNTPDTYFFVEAWNPAELPLPNPPDFKLTVRGSDMDAMAETARDLSNEIKERKIFTRMSVEPNASLDESLRLRPRLEQWPLLAAQGYSFSLHNLADLTRTATSGRYVTHVELGGDDMEIHMRYPEHYVSTPEELEALPVGAGGRILPLKALAQVTREEVRPSIRRENGRELFVLSGRVEKGEEKQADDKARAATALVERWPEVVAERKAKFASLQGASLSDEAKRENVPTSAVAKAKAAPTLQIEDAKVELTSALDQLVIAVSLSIALIFLTMVFQFGSVMNSLLVLVAVPLGVIGVLISLFVFGSTLSLNSMLGVILLNGLAVANSIILVDFLQRAVREGVAPRLAAVQVARARLRPILMTSLTTGLGMLPIALGFGEGGKILQPLGIAVTGGLGFSMITTLFIVPALQVAWLEWKEKNSNARSAALNSASAIMSGAIFIVAVGSAFVVSGEARAQAATPSPTLTFKEAYQSILDRSLRLQAQRLNVETNVQQRRQRIGAFTPSISFDVNETRVGEPLVGPQRGGAINGRINLFRSGADLAALKASSQDLQSNRERLLSEQQTAEEETIQALAGVISRSLRTKIVRKIALLKQDSLRVARERYDRGLLPLQEVEKQGIEVENSKARLIDAETAEIEARAALRGLLGHDNIAIEWPWREVLTKGSKIESEAFKLERRPDWRAALATSEAEQLRTRSALGALLPSLDLIASYGHEDLSTLERRDWSVTLTLSLPLFDSFRGWTGYQIQSLAHETARLQVEAIRRTAPAEFESFKRSFEAARDSALTREKTAKLTEKLLADNMQRFRLGRASVNELEIDQDRLFESELLAVEGWLNAHISYIRLCHALGSNVEPTGECRTPKN